MRIRTAGPFTSFVLAAVLAGTAVHTTLAAPADLQPAIRIPANIPASLLLPASSRQIPRRRNCNLKKRVLAGAAIGAVAGMVAINKAAASNGGSADGTATLLGAGYGGAIGALIGLRSCW